MPRTARCTTARHAVATGSKNPLVDPRAGAPVASDLMISTTRTPGALTVGPLRPVILKLAAPAVAMMACHFCFNLIDAIWVGRLIGPAALAAVSTAGFYVWVLLSLGEMVEVGLIAVAARRHGEGLPDAAARTARVRLLRDRGDVPRLGRHAHTIPSAHGLGRVVGGPRPAAHQRRRSVPEARSRGRRARLRDGAGWRVPHRYRHRLATRPDTPRCPRLARPAHGVPRGRPALAGGGPALGRVHVAHAVHVPLRYRRARGARRRP